MNIRHGLPLLVLGVIHLTFLVVVFWGNSNNLGVQLLMISSLVLLIFGYANASKLEVKHSKLETVVQPFVVALAGLLTYYLSVDVQLGPVIASAGVGFVASYFVLFKSPFLKSLPVPIYCGTFVGMSSNWLVADYFFVMYPGLVAGLIYVLTRDAMHGIGGKLGTIAFGGVVVVSLIFWLL